MKKSFDAKHIPSRMAASAVALYRAAVSPFLPPACRFAPTCSEYAHDAFLSHGFFRGLYLSINRILRCHPLRKGGFDPVPEEGSRFTVHRSDVPTLPAVKRAL